MDDLATFHVHGVYTDDGRGSKTLAALFLAEDDAKDEEKRLSAEGAFVAKVPVFAKRVGGWRNVFRQREGRSE
jgi:hypothetical protein